jgi:hypothetical protein
MFNGPYLITEVNHTITPGSFQTSFGGIRQSIYELPPIDSFLQSINQNLLTRIEAIVKSKKDSVTAKAITNVNKSKYVSQVANSTAAAQNSCTSNLASVYETWGDVQSSTTMSLTQNEFVAELEKKTSNVRLQVLIYCICYVKTFRDGKFYGYNNNYANITLTTNYGESGKFFSDKKYSCVNISNLTGEPTSQPVANFDDIGKFFDFMTARLSSQTNRVFDNPNSQLKSLGVEKYYVCYWPVSNVSEEYYDSHRNEYTTLTSTFNKAFKSAGDAGLDIKSVEQLRAQSIRKQTPTPTTNNLNTTTNVPPSCPPPFISSFSPLTGVSGTIITILGDNLDGVTGMTINNVTTTTGITIINASNISVIVPYSNTTVAQTNPIILKGTYGDSISFTLNRFTYNPEQVTPSIPLTIPGAPPNVNTQPQQTGPVALTGKTTSNLIGSDESLTVGVNPAAGNWEILSQFNNWQYKVVKRVLGPNNVVVEEVLDEGEVQQEFRSNVSADKQKFFLDDFNLFEGLKRNSDLTDKEISGASIIYNKFEFVASSPDKFTKFGITNNPNDVISDIYLPFSMTIIFP